MKRLGPMVLRTLAVLLLAAVLLVCLWVSGNVLRAAIVQTHSEAELAPPGGRWWPAGDADLFVQTWGPADGPVLVLTHGTGAWSGTWFDAPQALAKRGWRVVAVDLPPFGFSRTPAQIDYRRSEQARRLIALLRQLGDKPVVLVGHSFGAGPALEAAMREPQRVRQTVLVDPALGLGPAGEMPPCMPTEAGPLMAWRPMRTAIVSSTATVPWFTGSLLGQFVHRQEAVTEPRLEAYRAQFGRHGYSARLGDWAESFGSQDCRGAVSTGEAALVAWAREAHLALIWGDEDTITPLAQGIAMQRRTGARLVRIPGVGHIPHLEDPRAFDEALASVLEEPPDAGTR
jgi:pimeloyl-ACP methyl ester carboxylesterase